MALVHNHMKKETLDAMIDAVIKQNVPIKKVYSQ